MALANQLDKGEIKIMKLIADFLISNNHLNHAIEIYRKMGDYKNLAMVYIKNGQWEEVGVDANDPVETVWFVSI